jgi:hypothetical protein
MPVLAELSCAGCGRKSYIPVAERIPPCPECGAEQRVVNTFRDRRRVPAPVKRDRRRPSDPGVPQPGT